MFFTVPPFARVVTSRQFDFYIRRKHAKTKPQVQVIGHSLRLIVETGWNCHDPPLFKCNGGGIVGKRLLGFGEESQVRDQKDGMARW